MTARVSSVVVAVAAALTEVSVGMAAHLGSSHASFARFARLGGDYCFAQPIDESPMRDAVSGVYYQKYGYQYAFPQNEWRPGRMDGPTASRGVDVEELGLAQDGSIRDDLFGDGYSKPAVAKDMKPQYTQNTDEQEAVGSRPASAEPDDAYLALTPRWPYGLSPHALRQFLAMPAPQSQTAEASAAATSTRLEPSCPSGKAAGDFGSNRSRGENDQPAQELAGEGSPPKTDIACEGGHGPREHATTSPREEAERKLKEGRFKEECKDAIRQRIALAANAQRGSETTIASPERETEGPTPDRDGLAEDSPGYESVTAFAHFGSQLESSAKSNADPTETSRPEYVHQPTASDTSRDDQADQDGDISTKSPQSRTGRHLLIAAIDVAVGSLDRMGGTLRGLSHRLKSMP